MVASVLWLVCFSMLFSSSLSCYQCFIDVRDSLRLCWGHILTKYNVRNVDSCFRKLDTIFNFNESVIEAGRVGEGYDVQLKEILNAEILPLVKEFDKKRNDDKVYDERLQKAADNFISAASKLPRVSGCFPPCGFQSKGREYNCNTCIYDTCGYPFDCPIKEIKVMEGKRIQMSCEVAYQLPNDIEMIWRFAEELKTQLVDQFTEVTSGPEMLYSIPVTELADQGTYQCEIFTGRLSIVRLYFYLIVTPLPLPPPGHSDLQDIFDMSIHPVGLLHPVPDEPPHTLRLPSTLLLTTCLTSVLLLLLLSLGVLCSIMMPKTISRQAESECGGTSMEGAGLLT